MQPTGRDARAIALAAALLAVGCGDSRAGTAPVLDAAVDLATERIQDALAPAYPEGGKRVTLRSGPAGEIRGEGFDLQSGEVKVATESDFALTIRQVVQLAPERPNVAFCRRQPPPGETAFTRVTDIPSDVTGCEKWPGWSTLLFGGNTGGEFPDAAGKGYVIRSRDSVPTAKLLVIAMVRTAPSEYAVTFDIARF